MLWHALEPLGAELWNKLRDDAAPADTERLELSSAMRRWLLALSADRPLLLAVDNLENADDASLGLLAELPFPRVERGLALRQLPLALGQLVFSGSGVFAATYRMTGNLDDPDVSVNPLATLAPGFLRGLFGIFEGGTPKQPDAVPDPSTEQEPLPEPQRD